MAKRKATPEGKKHRRIHFELSALELGQIIYALDKIRLIVDSTHRKRELGALSTRLKRQWNNVVQAEEV